MADECRPTLGSSWDCTFPRVARRGRATLGCAS